MKIVTTRSNRTTRVYKCRTCSSDLKHWTATVVNEGTNHWHVRPTYLPTETNRAVQSPIKNSLITTDFPCRCTALEKGKISDQLFFSSFWVHDTTYRHYDKSLSYIDAEIRSRFKEKCIPVECLPNIRARKNAISQHLVIYNEFYLKREYHHLPQYLSELGERNPDTSITLQSDTLGRFYRAFIGMPMGLSKHLQNLSIPVMFIDCCHYQCLQYDGIAITLSSKSGCGLSLVLAFGIIPVENIDHISWFLQLCALHGINFDCALFTDQGPLLSATKHLSETTTLKFTLMFCLQHLIRNVRHKFKAFTSDAPSNKHLQIGMDKIADSQNMELFFHSIVQMVDNFFKSGIDISTVVDVAFYVLRIHPRHWTVFGNSPWFSPPSYLHRVREILGQIVSASLLWD